MKKILYIVMISLFGVLVGCSDYLDSEPLSFTSIANFYKDQNDAEAALTGCYGLLQDSYSVNGRTGVF